MCCPRGFFKRVLLLPSLASGSSSGMSADEVRAALRSAEDETDAAAAIEAEKEEQNEMEEFTQDPPKGAAAQAGGAAGATECLWRESRGKNEGD